MVAECATIATTSCQALGERATIATVATIRWMVATVADFATVHSKSRSQALGGRATVATMLPFVEW